jgi:hypothetical protein
MNCVLVYLQILSETFLILRRDERDMIDYFLSNSTAYPYRIRGPPPSWFWPKCHRLVRLGPHRARLRCPDDVNDDMCERGVPGGALNLNSTGYPDHGRYGDLPLQGKIPTAEP